MAEEWRDIEGFEGRYQISNFGNVKSLRYGGGKEAKNLVPKVNNYGYEWVELFTNGKGHCRQVHRLVADAFIPNVKKYPIVNHKDENTRNNNVNNLEWCSYKYNVRYSINRHYNDPQRHDNHRSGAYGPYKHLKPIAQIDRNGKVVKVWDCSRQVEREERKSQWSIIQCCNGNRKTAYGYTWRYVDAN